MGGAPRYVLSAAILPVMLQQSDTGWTAAPTRDDVLAER